MILVSIPFTGLGLFDGFSGDKWFKKRIEIFRRFTLKSLLHQTDKNFVIWLQFRPEEKGNPLLKTIKIPHKHIFTFGGITIWDDKKPNEKKGLLNRLTKTLPDLETIVGKEDVKMVNLGSDDMYSGDVIGSINKEPFKEGTALTHKNGYIYGYITDRLADWNPATNPPFYCIMFKNKTFLDPKKHFKFVKDVKSHEFIPTIFKEKRMPDGRYCVGVHDHNISTIFDHRFRGKEYYYENAKGLILKNFGIKL